MAVVGRSRDRRGPQQEGAPEQPTPARTVQRERGTEDGECQAPAISVPDQARLQTVARGGSPERAPNRGSQSAVRLTAAREVRQRRRRTTDASSAAQLRRQALVQLSLGASGSALVPGGACPPALRRAAWTVHCGDVGAESLRPMSRVLGCASTARTRRPMCGKDGESEERSLRRWR